MVMNAQEALAAVHGLWKRVLEACVGWGWAEACPLGLAPGGADEFGEGLCGLVLGIEISEYHRILVSPGYCY